MDKKLLNEIIDNGGKHKSCFVPKTNDRDINLIAQGMTHYLSIICYLRGYKYELKKKIEKEGYHVITTTHFVGNRRVFCLWTNRTKNEA